VGMFRLVLPKLFLQSFDQREGPNGNGILQLKDPFPSSYRNGSIEMYVCIDQQISM
jgi:hypothetical protein